MRDLPGIVFPFRGFIGHPGSLFLSPGQDRLVKIAVDSAQVTVQLWFDEGDAVFRPLLRSGGMLARSEQFAWTTNITAGQTATERYLRDISMLASCFLGRNTVALEPFLRDVPDHHEFVRRLNHALEVIPQGFAQHSESLLSASDKYLRNVG